MPEPAAACKVTRIEPDLFAFEWTAGGPVFATLTRDALNAMLAALVNNRHLTLNGTRLGPVR